MGRARGPGPLDPRRSNYDTLRLLPGVFEVSRTVPVGRAIEEILLIAKFSLEGEWEGQVRYLPLR